MVIMEKILAKYSDRISSNNDSSVESRTKLFGTSSGSSERM